MTALAYPAFGSRVMLCCDSYGWPRAAAQQWQSTQQVGCGVVPSHQAVDSTGSPDSGRLCETVLLVLWVFMGSSRAVVKQGASRAGRAGLS
jgi:hypothetical protein